jgi:RimJ/RimL family protein N-acetyltransferase
VPSWFTTRDGYKLFARFIRADDAPRLIDLFDRLSPESRRRRFHQTTGNLPEELKQQYATQLAGVDNRTTGGAVVAVDLHDEPEAIVGVARLARPEGMPDSPEAEAAIVVRDDFQGRGVGYQLIRRMVALARRMRVRTIIATIQTDNLAAFHLFRALPLPMTMETRRGETVLHIAMKRPRRERTKAS